MLRVSAKLEAKRSSTYLTSVALSSSAPVLLPVAAGLGQVPSPPLGGPEDRTLDVNG
jgi:hypothetical protein